jgi:hypothetical protein
LHIEPTDDQAGRSIDLPNVWQVEGAPTDPCERLRGGGGAERDVDAFVVFRQLRRSVLLVELHEADDDIWS